MNEILKSPEIRRKLLFTFLIIVLFRFLAHVPTPGVDTNAIKAYISSNSLLGFYDLFSGGGFQNFSIVTLGLSPYITASIIIQLFTTMIPAFEELSKEGESGRDKLDQYTRILTIPISFVQAYGVYFLLNQQGVIGRLETFNLLVLIFTLIGGGMFLVWVGDLVTEYGVGNGISLLIFVGIISSLPTNLIQFYYSSSTYSFLNILLFVAVTLAVIVTVVLINEGTRNIPLEYGKRGVRSEKVTNYLPLKVNQAGVIPIIFAVSVVLIPSFLSGPLLAASNITLVNIGGFLARNFVGTAPLYNAFYFVLVVGFTFFYTFIQFDPEKISNDIKQRGGFIPGTRPGKSTKDYLGKIILRLTFFGAIFLGLIAIMPYFVQLLTGQTNLAIGGTGLLIAVSVVLETIRQLEAQTVSKNYDSFLD